VSESACSRSRRQLSSLVDNCPSAAGQKRGGDNTIVRTLGKNSRVLNAGEALMISAMNGAEG